MVVEFIYDEEGKGIVDFYRYISAQKLRELVQNLPERVHYVACNEVQNIALYDVKEEFIGVIDIGNEEIEMYDDHLRPDTEYPTDPKLITHIEKKEGSKRGEGQ